MSRLIPLGEAQTNGELKTLRYLESELPHDWFILGNPTITAGRRSRELDAVVVGHRCIWAVDEKSYSGVITGDVHVWSLSRGKGQVSGVIDNIQLAARLLKGAISKKLPQFSNIWVQPIILLSAATADLRVDDERSASFVRPLRGCSSYFIKSSRMGGQSLGHHDRELIVRCLAGDITVDKFLEVAAQNDNLPRRYHGSARTAMSNPLFLRLDGPNGFRRIYYDDVIVDDGQLRGVRVKKRVTSKLLCRIQVGIQRNGVLLSISENSCKVFVGDRVLAQGTSLLLPPGTSELQVGELTLTATVADYQPRIHR